MKRLFGVAIVLLVMGGCAASPATMRHQADCKTHSIGHNQTLTECN